MQSRIAGYAQLAREFDINPTGVSATDARFVQRLVFGGTGTTPRAQFRAVLPTPDAGLIAVRLRADLSDADRRRAVELVQRAVALPDFRLTHGGTYVVSGSPVLVDAVAGELERALLALLGVGVLVMALVLAATFPERRRLGPLLLALGTVAVVFGGMGLLGLPADLGTIATLPVLLGLAVDYGVQLHARVEESRRAGLAGREAVRDAVARGGRPIVLAAGATLVGFVALLASPTPLVRGFALVLGAGVALAVLAAFTVGLVLHARRAPRPAAVPVTPEAEAATGPRRADPVAPAALPAGGLGTGPVVRRLVAGAYGRPRSVLAVGVVLAVAGIVLGAREPVETSIERLVPRDLPAVRDLGAVERESGQAGELQVLLRGRDLARPEVLAWADALRARVLRGAGYDAARATGCRGRARLCPLSVPFSALLGQDPAKLRDAAAVRTALAGLPEYFTSAAITADRRSILLSFGVPVGPLDRQRATIDAVRRAAAAGRPAGVDATVTGLPTLAADASASISSPARRILTLLGTLVLVAGLLLAATRSARRGLLPVLPVALAAGWSGLLTWALGLPLNPLSVVLGTLIVAIGTEFGVLLLERYGQERAAGHPDAVALARTAASTGRAVGASAATTVAGFGVLAVSDFPLLRQFGLITVLDLLVAVLAVVVVLPAVAGLAAGRRRDGGTATVGPAPERPAREEVPA
nr:MMPL family transporter [Patulibacter sp. SYSU D01012]